MVNCEYDNDVSGDLMGWKLPAWQALLLHRVLPSCGGLIIYLTLICFDFTLVYEHFINKDSGLACFNLILITLPALLTFIFTLASPPAGLKTEEDTITINVEKKDVYWILFQILKFFTFPIAAIVRYSHQIFWWIESVFAAHARDEERIQEAVLKAREPSSVELYLFLQAFLHAAPHAITNLLDIMGNIDKPNFEKIELQAVSLVVSCLRMASTATIYRRFEREKICGRQYPWNIAQPLLDNLANEKIEEEINRSFIFDQQELPIPTCEDIPSVNDETDACSSVIHDPDERMWAKYSQIIESDESLPSSSGFHRKSSIANSDRVYTRPLSIIDRVAPRRRNTEHTIDSTDVQPPSTVSSDDHYVRPRSLIGRLTPQRKSTHYTIEAIDVPPPPDTPPPGIIGIWAEKIVENVESFPHRMSAPPRRKYIEDEVIQDEPDIPVRIPRSYMRGLQSQDGAAGLMHFLAWYMFFVGRLISVAAFINLFPIVAIIILFCHYQVMLLFLIVPPASSIRRSFYLFLAFVYLFCLMEFKVRFRHVRVWHVFWILVCTLETIIFTGMWATIDNDIHWWWRQYAVMVVLGSTALSYMCMLVYFLILKPKETKIYMNGADNIKLKR